MMNGFMVMDGLGMHCTALHDEWLQDHEWLIHGSKCVLIDALITFIRLSACVHMTDLDGSVQKTAHS